MDEPFDRPKPRVDIGTLQVGRRYRVDWKRADIRRSFRITATLLSIDERRGEGGAVRRSLAFEVKPRFGKATVQRVDAEALLAVVPA